MAEIHRFRILRYASFSLSLGALFVAPQLGCAGTGDTQPVIYADSLVESGTAVYGVVGLQVYVCGFRQPSRTPAQIGVDVCIGVKNIERWFKELESRGILVSGTTKFATPEDFIEQHVPDLRLLIGDRVMRTLRPVHAFKDDPEWYTYDPDQKIEAKQRYWLEFRLDRNPLNGDSRQDWNTFLTGTRGVKPDVVWNLGIFDSETNTAHVLGDWLAREEKTPFARIPFDGWTITAIIVIAGALLILFLLARNSGILRDPTQPRNEDGLPPYSLSRCQMAFWFFVTAAAFFFLWIITGRGDTDTINSTVLTLIGISAGTAIGGAIISRNQADPNVAITSKRNIPAEIRAAQGEESAAKAARNALRLDDPALGAANRRIEYTTAIVAKLKDELAAWRRAHWPQFLTDILSDEDTPDGRPIITFHRFQIVVWTFVLGVIFISDVCSKLTMPVFDNTLLTLMGISSGTYLGFRLTPAQK